VHNQPAVKSKGERVHQIQVLMLNNCTHNTIFLGASAPVLASAMLSFKKKNKDTPATLRRAV
jgi:hypothetical protein